MKKLFPLISEIRKIRSKWKVPVKMVQSRWRRFIEKDVSRLWSSATMSGCLHLVMFCIYLALVQLDRPVQPPLQEISFIDLTEDDSQFTSSELIPEEKEVPRSQKAFKERMRNLPLHPVKIEKIGDGFPKRITPRNQPPIQLKKVEPVANLIPHPDEILRITPLLEKGTLPLKSKPNPSIDVTGKDSSPADISGGKEKTPFKHPVGSSISSPETVSLVPPDGNYSLFPRKSPDKKVQSATSQLPNSLVVITGPLAHRKILRKTLPSFPYWAKRKGVGATISLRFTVMEDGTVKENVIVERTSGSREWDQMVVQALKSWQFAALEESEIRIDQTGVITFQFII